MLHALLVFQILALSFLILSLVKHGTSTLSNGTFALVVFTSFIVVGTAPLLAR